MATDIYLKVEGVDGESVRKGVEKWIDLEAYSWGASQSGTAQYGTGGGSGRANVQDLHVTKFLDKTTPVLLQNLLTGKPYAKIELKVRKVSGGDPIDYLTITLTEAIVSSYSTGAGKGDDDRIVEQLSFNFATVKMEYILQNKDGTPGGKVPASYDVAQGKTM